MYPAGGIPGLGVEEGGGVGSGDEVWAGSEVGAGEGSAVGAAVAVAGNGWKGVGVIRPLARLSAKAPCCFVGVESDPEHPIIKIPDARSRNNIRQ